MERDHDCQPLSQGQYMMVIIKMGLMLSRNYLFSCFSTEYKGWRSGPEFSWSFKIGAV